MIRYLKRDGHSLNGIQNVKSWYNKCRKSHHIKNRPMH